MKKKSIFMTFATAEDIRKLKEAGGWPEADMTKGQVVMQLRKLIKEKKQNA